MKEIYWDIDRKEERLFLHFEKEKKKYLNLMEIFRKQLLKVILYFLSWMKLYFNWRINKKIKKINLSFQFIALSQLCHSFPSDIKINSASAEPKLFMQLLNRRKLSYLFICFLFFFLFLNLFFLGDFLNFGLSFWGQTLFCLWIWIGLR